VLNEKWVFVKIGWSEALGWSGLREVVEEPTVVTGKMGGGVSDDGGGDGRGSKFLNLIWTWGLDLIRSTFVVDRVQPDVGG
jgi:hypothetical protein